MVSVTSAVSLFRWKSGERVGGRVSKACFYFWLEKNGGKAGSVGQNENVLKLYRLSHV